MEIQWGLVFAFTGAALAGILAGIGSALGVSRAGQAASGVLSEYPERFASILVLQALPGTQGVYGLLIAFMILLKVNVFGGMEDVSTVQGLILLAGSLPVAVVGLISAVMQGQVAITGIHLVGKRADASGKAITMTVMVETYAVLALLLSFLIVFFGVSF